MKGKRARDLLSGMSAPAATQESRDDLEVVDDILTTPKKLGKRKRKKTDEEDDFSVIPAEITS